MLLFNRPTYIHLQLYRPWVLSSYSQNGNWTFVIMCANSDWAAAKWNSRIYFPPFVQKLRWILEYSLCRIPKYGVRIFLRGPLADIDYAVGHIRIHINRDLQQTRMNHYSAWPTNPSFQILTSASKIAIKSDLLDEVNDHMSDKIN